MSGQSRDPGRRAAPAHRRRRCRLAATASAALLLVSHAAARQDVPPPERLDPELLRQIRQRDFERGVVRLDGVRQPGVVRPGSTLPDARRLATIVVDARTLELIELLDAPEWATREQAARTLVERNDRDAAGAPVDEQIMAALDRLALSDEQRHRLLGVLCERLLTVPRGALGIRMLMGMDGRPGVEISEILPGMPAERVLRPGDRILSIDGREVIDSQGLITIIQVERPGRTVRLEVERRGRNDADPQGAARPERLFVELELGSSDQLDRFDAWRDRGGRTASIRHDQVREATMRFASAPTNVPVQRLVVPPGSQPESPDEDPQIRSLLSVRRLLAEGLVTISPAMRSEWTRTLQELAGQAAAAPPGPEQDRLRRLAARYAELIPR